MKVKLNYQGQYEIPEYATSDASGMDIYANISAPVELQSLGRQLIETGIYVAIDADYRGEIKVALVNLSDKIVSIEPGERIAQMILAKIEKIEWIPVEVLSTTDRGAGGFGSTGEKKI